jgi:hypothetical protein
MNTNYDLDWRLKMRGHPASQRFLGAVNELMRSQGLSRDTAWEEARRRYPSLYQEMSAVNELPRGAELSGDGQRLLRGDWPVSPNTLAELGLPLESTREEYEIFRAAAKVDDFPPEYAAKFVVLLIQFQQLSGGMKFEMLMSSLRKNFPKLFAALKNVIAVNELYIPQPANVPGSVDAGSIEALSPAFFSR